MYVPLDLKRHVVYADIICAGTIEDLDVRPSGGPDCLVAFRVGRVHKGEISAGSVIRISYPAGHQELSGNDLILLKKQDDDYIFSQPMGSMRVSEASHSSYMQSDEVDSNLRWELLNSLKSSSAEVVADALRQASVLQQTDIVTRVKPLIGSSDINVRGLALVAAVLAGQADAVDPLLQLMEQLYRTDRSGMLLWECSTALYGARVTADMVPRLGNALRTTGPVGLRRIVSFMLRKSGDAAALEFLRTSLDSPDQRERYHAVMGFAEITKDFSHAPCVDKFKENEQEYVRYWKEKSADIIK